MIIMDTPMFVNRPMGDVIPDDKKPSDYLYCHGFRVEPKVGCCDKGNDTKEERVVIVKNDDGYMVYNRQGNPYSKDMPTAVLDKLKPLSYQHKVFDCGFFPQSKNLVVYGLPRHVDDDPMSYLEMRRVLEAYLPISLDIRLTLKFSELYPVQADGREPDLADHSSGMVWESTDKDKDPETVTWQRICPYRDITITLDKPHVYILPTFKPGPYLDVLWQAMKECPDTTYEGMVIKPEYRPQIYTDKQSDNKSWIKIRWR